MLFPRPCRNPASALTGAAAAPIHWLELDDAALARAAAASAQPAYRAGQLHAWLHADRVDGFSAMSNLPAAWRAELDACGRLRVFEPRARRAAADGLAEKWTFAAPDGALVEVALIRERQGRRRTACLSTMAGCPLGCVFCATGRHGYKRSLSTGEMLELAYRIDAACRAGPLPKTPRDAPADAGAGDDDPEAREMPGAGIGNAVFMGMGEPLLNLEATLAAARKLADPRGLGLSGRRITLSTVGIPEGLRRLAAANANFRLAWSLHTVDQALRDRLLPGARGWPLQEVWPAVRAFAARAARDVTVEYCLIGGVNDGPGAARALAGFLSGERMKVNLIPLNPTPGYAGRPPSPATTRRFLDILLASGVPATTRAEKGADIGAACGQLAGRHAEGVDL